VYLVYDLFRKRSVELNYFISFSFILVLIFFVGFRDFKVGVDTENYAISIQELKEMLDGKDPGFFAVSIFFHWITTIKGVIFLYSLTFFSLFFIFLIRYDKKNTLLLLFLFSSFFFFKSLSINIVRQGISISAILLAFSSSIHKKNKQTLLWFIIGISIHLTSLIFFLIYIIQKKIVKLKTIIILFFLSIILSLIKVGFHSIVILGGYADELNKFDELADKFGYKTGFRYDFVLFNSLFFLLGVFIYKIKSENKERLFLVLKFYGLTSVFFFLSFYFPYSDRMGIISWVFIPLILLEVPITPMKYFPLRYSFIITCMFILFLLQNIAVK
jgi:hypothetical protein